MIEKNQILEVTVQDYGSDGEGVCKIDDYVIFVPDAVIGDVLRVKITKLKKNFGHGKIIEILEKSSNRTNPPCKHFDLCGGCTLQHINYDSQVKFKENKVLQNLSRIGKIKNPKVNQILTAKDNYNYRNKAQFPFGMLNGKAVIGYYEKKSHNIISVDDCLIVHPLINKVRNEMQAFIDNHKISVFDENTGKGVLRHLIIKASFSTNEVMVVLVVNSNTLVIQKELVAHLTKISEVKSIFLNHNRKNNKVILGNNLTHLFGKEFITDKICDLSFNISPLSFFQVNTFQAEKLYKTAIDFMKLKGDEIVFDAYCGIGTISLLIAQQVKKVIGIEVIEDAIKNAIENQKLNNINNVSFVTGSVENALMEVFETNGIPDVLLVDPPRKGLDPLVVQSILTILPKKIVYVSCDSGTLSRDLQNLCEEKYEMIEATPVDLFCQSGHVETVVLLSRVK